MGFINVTVTAKTPHGVTVELKSDGHSIRSLPFVLDKMIAEAEQAALPSAMRTPAESAQEESHVT